MFGCSSKPSNIRDGVYKLGLEALDIYDEYLDIKITSSEAENKIKKLIDRLNEFEKSDDELIVKTENKVKSNLSVTESIFVSMKYNMGSHEDILKFRNILAEELNEKPRKN